LRVYWTLKAAGHDPVSILDGGVAGWTAADHPIAARPSKPQLSPPYPVRINSAVRALTSDIEVALQQGSATLLDARSRAQFEGREKSPQVTRAGRLPGDVHVDHTRAFESGTGRLRSQEELSQIFSIVASGDAVSYCNTGHLASTNWFVLSEVLGRPDVSLFGGSMSERTYDPGRPVEVGPSATGQGSERQG
jgi:thiosulfate/3-mercaptopyruvate sulfurtransferase